MQAKYTTFRQVCQRAKLAFGSKNNLNWPNYEIGYCTADWISRKFGEQIGRYRPTLPVN